MAKLGRPARIVYQAKNSLSGLTDIIARVFKPDGSQAGNYPLIAISGVHFSGFYYFDYITSVGDDLGDYIGVVISPTEGIKTPFKINYDGKISDSIGGSGSVEDVVSMEFVFDESQELDFYFDQDPTEMVFTFEDGDTTIDFEDDNGMVVDFDLNGTIEVEFTCAEDC